MESFLMAPLWATPLLHLHILGLALLCWFRLSACQSVCLWLASKFHQRHRFFFCHFSFCPFTVPKAAVVDTTMVQVHAMRVCLHTFLRLSPFSILSFFKLLLFTLLYVYRLLDTSCGCSTLVALHTLLPIDFSFSSISIFLFVTTVVHQAIAVLSSWLLHYTLRWMKKMNKW